MTNTMNAQQAGHITAQQKQDTGCSAGSDQQMYLSKLIFNWGTTAWFMSSMECQLSWEYKRKPAELRLKAGSFVWFIHGPLHRLRVSAMHTMNAL